MYTNRPYDKVLLALVLIGTAFLLGYWVSQRQWLFEIGKWLCCMSLVVYWFRRIFVPARQTPAGHQEKP
jgi:uncharacterized membrane protein